MQKFKEKRRLRQFFYSKGTILLLVIVLFFLGRAVISAHQKFSLTQRNETAAMREYEELRERKEILKHDVERLNTERGLEEELRKKFNIAKPGEEVINIVE